MKPSKAQIKLYKGVFLVRIQTAHHEIYNENLSLIGLDAYLKREILGDENESIGNLDRETFNNFLECVQVMALDRYNLDLDDLDKTIQLNF